MNAVMIVVMMVWTMVMTMTTTTTTNLGIVRTVTAFQHHHSCIHHQHYYRHRLQQLQSSLRRSSSTFVVSSPSWPLFIASPTSAVGTTAITTTTTTTQSTTRIDRPSHRSFHHHRRPRSRTVRLQQQISNDDRDSEINKKPQKQKKKKKNRNFWTEFIRAFSASSPTGNTRGGGGGGGSFNLWIDYDELPFPGPEVGSWALQQQQESSIDKPSSSAGNNNNDERTSTYPSLMPATSPSLPHLELMTVAGGCFWGIQLCLDRVKGIEYTLTGYTQGRPSETRPNYDQVSLAGVTHHTEAVLVYFDPTVVSYETIIRDVFLNHIDPTTVNGQGRDYGRQYRTGIYTHTLQQEETARRLLMGYYNTASNSSSNNKKMKPKPIATEVCPATIFWPAEAYHQKYLERGGRYGERQSAEKGSTEPIRCYG